MAALQKPKIILIFALSFAIVIASLFPLKISGEVQPIEEVQEKLESISDKEKAVLADLFILLQKIEEMEREAERVNGEIGVLQDEIRDVEKLIAKQQEKYDKQLDTLRQVLVSYQRSGPASYLETLLSSKDLSSFLKNLNILKDLTKNVGELLDSVEELERELTVEKEKLSEKVRLLEDKKAELQLKLDESIRLREEQEAYLDSLEEEREYYEEQLGNLQQMWDEIKALFSDIVQEFSRIMIEGEFPLKDLNLEIGLFTVRGTVYEDVLNEVLKGNKTLSGVEFHFLKDRVDIEVPEKHLVLKGAFSVEDKSVLKFEVSEGSFYDMPLEPESINELFRNGYLLIDFKELIGDYIDITLESIEMEEGSLKFQFKPDFLWLRRSGG